MVTVSQVVKRLVDSRPMLQESMIEEIVNFSNLAVKLQPRIESELGQEVKKSAVVMALRRYADQLQSKTVMLEPFKVSPEIIMKTNISDICVLRTPTALEKIKEIYKMVDNEKGETLNVIQGNYEITIVLSQKYVGELLEMLKGEKVLNTEEDLVSLTLNLGRDFLYTPGILGLATRKLAWENINIFENISTMTELIFIIAEKDAVKAYNAFQEMVKEYSVT